VVEYYLSQGAPAERERRKRRLEKGLDDPEAQAALRIYDDFLAAMETQLSRTTWLAGPSFSLAEVGVIPYVNRLDMLQLSGMWTDSRPRLTDWWHRVKARPSFAPALMKYVPPPLTDLMAMHGSEAWPRVRAILRDKA
jgi:glutathione S-transferase